jgi:hypothetical protein
VKTQTQQLDATQSGRAGAVGVFLLALSRLAQQRPRPGTIEHPRLALLIDRELIEIHVAGSLSIAAAARLQAPGYIAHHTVKKGAKTAGPVAFGTGEDAALLKAFDEHLLHGVIEILQVRRISPARRYIGADHRMVMLGKRGALGRAPRYRCLDDRPASAFPLRHVSGRLA